MIIWKGSSMESFFADNRVMEDWPCVVKIDQGRIRVEYKVDGRTRIYAGTEEQPGHFRLSCPELNGKATLHRFADDEELRGDWLEGGYFGMWRITLDE